MNEQKLKELLEELYKLTNKKIKNIEIKEVNEIKDEKEIRQKMFKDFFKITSKKNNKMYFFRSRKNGKIDWIGFYAIDDKNKIIIFNPLDGLYLVYDNKNGKIEDYGTFDKKDRKLYSIVNNTTFSLKSYDDDKSEDKKDKSEEKPKKDKYKGYMIQEYEYVRNIRLRYAQKEYTMQDIYDNGIEKLGGVEVYYMRSLPVAIANVNDRFSDEKKYEIMTIRANAYSGSGNFDMNKVIEVDNLISDSFSRKDNELQA